MNTKTYAVTGALGACTNGAECKYPNCACISGGVFSAPPSPTPYEPVGLCAPFPGMGTEWTQEQIDKLDAVLAEYPPEPRAPTPAAEEVTGAADDKPFMWLEADPSARNCDPRDVFGKDSMLYSTRTSMTKPDSSNPCWPLYLRPAPALPVVEDPELLIALQPIIAAVGVQDRDTIGSMVPDDAVIWCASGSWEQPAPVTLGDMRRIANIVQNLPIPAPAIDTSGECVDSAAPWPDHLGQPIRHGQRLSHPDGNEFVAVRLSGYADEGDAWRAIYDDCTVSRLCLQIGSKGQAFSVEPPATQNPAWSPDRPTWAQMGAGPVSPYAKISFPYTKDADIQAAIRLLRDITAVFDLDEILTRRIIDYVERYQSTTTDPATYTAQVEALAADIAEQELRKRQAAYGGACMELGEYMAKEGKK